MSGTHQHRLGTTMLLGLACTALIATLTCSRSEQTSSAPGTVAAVMGDRPECPLTDSVIIDTVTVIPVAGHITHIPEFHDCQRFIHKNPWIVSWFRGKWGYGSLYAIFVSDTVEGLWPSVPPGPIKVIDPRGGTRDTLASNGSIPTPQQPTQQTTPTSNLNGRVWGEVVSWSGDYQPLGIGVGFNCLVLWVQDTTKLRAFMVKRGVDNPSCPPYTSIPTGDGVKELEVQRTSVPGYKIGDYPPVARWDWDSVNAEHYIGTICGPAWCQIGDTGFQSSSAHSVGTVSYQNRVVEIRGWYDEQRLAVKGPSMIVGTAIPDPGLDTFKVADFMGTWVPSAKVALPIANQMYLSTYNFSQAALGSPAQVAGLNRIELCAETNGECHVTDVTDCPFPPQPVTWWARIIPPGGDSTTAKHKCVLRRGHPEVNKHIPGSVRWRWLKNDETTWMRCDQGCCQVY